MEKNAANPKCKNCDKPFSPRREDQAFCSADCRKNWHRHGRLTVAKMREIYRKEAGRQVAELAAELAQVKSVLAATREELAQMRVTLAAMREESRPRRKAAAA